MVFMWWCVYSSIWRNVGNCWRSFTRSVGTRLAPHGTLLCWIRNTTFVGSSVELPHVSIKLVHLAPWWCPTSNFNCRSLDGSILLQDVLVWLVLFGWQRVLIENKKALQRRSRYRRLPRIKYCDLHVRRSIVGRARYTDLRHTRLSRSHEYDTITITNTIT